MHNQQTKQEINKRRRSRKQETTYQRPKQTQERTKQKDFPVGHTPLTSDLNNFPQSCACVVAVVVVVVVVIKQSRVD
jgi:hypothetical protein